MEPTCTVASSPFRAYHHASRYHCVITSTPTIFSPATSRGHFFKSHHSSQQWRPTYRGPAASNPKTPPVASQLEPQPPSQPAPLSKAPPSATNSNSSSKIPSNTSTSPSRPTPPSLPSSPLPTDVIAWGGSNPPTRRLLLGSFTGLGIALGADFLGCTSFLLGLNADLFRSFRADLLYPIDGFKRCLELSRGFEFIYPKEWVGDQRLVYRAVERGERDRALDPPSLSATIRRGRSATSAVEPIVAFGPPGTSGELNVSVIVAPLVAGFRLEAFGNAQSVGERLLANVIAPKSSGLEANLLGAEEKKIDGILYYTLEFTVEGPSFYRHNVAVYAAYDDELYSLNAQAPQDIWPLYSQSFQAIANSFRIAVGTAQLVDVPQTL